MKKFLLGVALVFAMGATAQDGVCGFDAHHQKMLDENPGMEEAIHEHFVRITSGQIGPNPDRSTYQIPVVFHIIYDDEESNISYAQIESCIDMLNEDYNRLNEDTVDIRQTADAPFKPVAADISIEFVLAKKDPQGNCTNGVQRRYSPAGSNQANDDVKHYNSGGLDAWPRDKYLNVWVVNTIETDGAGVTLGYAQFPYWGNASEYGIVIRHDRVGNTGTAISGDRTMTHEVGHCLGLLHTFQGGCHTSACDQNGDYCCDTPPVSEAQWSCMTTQNTCSGVPSGDFYGFDAYDQFENFMSYSPCQYMFSEDQKNIVQTNLNDISFLSNLTSASNATATGIDQPGVLCSAEFTSGVNVICAGQTIEYTDQSFFNITGRTWNFEGGSPATSGDSIVTVTYNTPGVYDVSLEATDGSSTVTSTETDYVIVMGDPGDLLPYSEGFETLSAFPDYERFLVVNPANDAQWELVDGFGSSGTRCIMLDNHGLSSGTHDEFISGTIDLSGVDPSDDIVFNFKYAYRKRNASNDEFLRFYISDDCGETWVLRKNIHGNGLSQEVQTSPYEPASEDWVQVDITNINSAYYVSSFRYKFVFENDGGNNIYIDDINLYPASMTSVDENEGYYNLSIYPNPTSGAVEISFTVQRASDYRITLTNALGQEVGMIYNGYLTEGTQKVNYNVENLPAGIYMLKIENEGLIETRKIVVR